MTLEEIEEEFKDRFESTRHYLRQLYDNAHLPDHLRVIAEDFAALGAKWARNLNDGIELSTALKHVRDAKDAFIRQAVADFKAFPKKL